MIRPTMPMASDSALFDTRETNSMPMPIPMTPPICRLRMAFQSHCFQ